MRAITLHRPWDWAMAHGGKDIENRRWEPWPAIIGQRIALHAGKKYDYEGAEFIRSILGASVTPMPQTTPSVIVAVTTVIGWVKVDEARQYLASGHLPAEEIERALRSPWLMGPFGWLVERTIALPKPVPCSGQRQLWTVPRAIEQQILEQLPGAA